MLKTILAFDTSMSSCSVSLLHNNNIYNFTKVCHKNHTKYILPMIKKILKINNISLNAIDIVAISKGPGYFSGIRIAISVAQGISLGLNLSSIIALSTILIMAEEVWNVYKISQVIAIINVNKNNIYIVKYVRNIHGLWIKLSKETILHVVHITKNTFPKGKTWALIGNGWNVLSKNILKELFITNIISPNSKYLISLILSNIYYQKTTFLHEITPRYLHERTL